MKCVIQKNCFFLKSVFNELDFPNEHLSEVGFWGRSNVGKSSLLNCLTKSKIAKTSKTPGRTKSLNFFEIPSKLRLVDFPGYGFAKVSKKESRNWNRLISNYLSKRRNIFCIFLLIDARHGLKEVDFDAINFLESFGNHFFIVLTKIDKVKSLDLKICLSKTENILKKKVAADEKIFLTSIKQKKGILELKKKIINIMG